MHISKPIRYLFPLTLCALATGCFPYHATTRMGFSGTVVDAETRAPLAGASISFAGSTNEPALAVSAADGTFTVVREKQWQLRFVIGDYFTDRMIGGTVSIRHDGYETNATVITPISAETRFHTKTALGLIPLKPLSKTH